MILVIDIGTTSLRAAAVEPDGRIAHVEQVAFPPDSPAPGLVEFDAAALADAVTAAGAATIAAVGSVEAVGVASQRASTVIWDRRTGRPLGPAIGWQDLRTLGDCLAQRAEHGFELAPNQTATKASWLIREHGADDWCVGTVDSWIVWHLTRGTAHVTDHTNAGVTGLYDLTTGEWMTERCETLGIDPDRLPRIVDTVGPPGSFGLAERLPGSPPITSVIGDQQASMVGQGCTSAGVAKITFGTGAMLDTVTGSEPRQTNGRSSRGTFAIVGWRHGTDHAYGTEAIMLSAGTAVDWLRDDLGLIETSADSHAVAASCDDSGGVVFVPAMLGIGTPDWDYGARGTLLGLTRGTTRAHVVRAVLEGIAWRGADLIAAAAADTGVEIGSVRIDGGMSRNPTFVHALADAAGIEVEVSPVVEATTVGAGLLAAVGMGHWDSVAETSSAWQPAARVEPGPTRPDPDRWHRALERSRRWIPELSALDF